MRVSKNSLGDRKLISEGGFGKVYRLLDYRLPGDPAPLAYKEFTTDIADQARGAEQAVDFRDAMSPGAQADLDRVAVWPRALVEDPPGTVIGLLMPLIRQDFFYEGEDVMTGEEKDLTRGIEWLFADKDYLAKAQVDIPDPDPAERLILLGKLVYAVGRLHKLGWVFGDISGKNAVWALRPPRVLLLDCDGAAPLTDLNRVQGNTRTWEPPEFAAKPHPPQSELTDVYKLGLAILRTLTQTMQAREASGPAISNALGAAGTMLVARAVDHDPHVRPTAKEMYDCLRQAVAPFALPPQVTFARLRKPFVIRGQDVRVDWQIGNATEATVSAGGHDHKVDLSLHPDGYSFRSAKPGPVTLTVGNKFGSLVSSLGEVSFYELPPLSISIPTLPAPHLPDLPRLSLDSMEPVLEKVPAISLPDLPALPTVQTYDLVDTLMRRATILMAPPDIATAVLDASCVVTQAIWDDANRRAEAMRPTP